MFDFLGLNSLLAGTAEVQLEIQSVLDFLYGLIVGVTNFLLQLQLNVINWALSSFINANSFLSQLWQGFIKGILLRVVDVLKRVYDWLWPKLSKLIQWVQKLQDWLNRHVFPIVRRIINIIQKVRRVLAILRALHIKWAEKLDATLAQIEGKVALVFAHVRGVLNAVTDIINVVLDPSILLRRPALVISVRRAVPVLVRAVTGLPIGFFMPSADPGADPEEQCPSCDSLPGGAFSGGGFLGSLSSLIPSEDFVTTIDGNGPGPSDVDAVQPLDYFTKGQGTGLDCEGPLPGADTSFGGISDSIVNRSGPWYYVFSFAQDAFELVTR